MVFSYLSSHVFLFQNNFYSSFTTGSPSLHLTHHPDVFIVALVGFCFVCFHPKFWAGSLGGMFLEHVRHQALPFTLKHQDLFFCHPTFLCRSTWYATVHRLSRRVWPGTSLRSVLWVWSHKHNMLGAQSCPVLPASLCALNGRCNLIQPAALGINAELRCTLSMGASHCSLLGKSETVLTTIQGNLQFIYSQRIKAHFSLFLESFLNCQNLLGSRVEKIYTKISIKFIWTYLQDRIYLSDIFLRTHSGKQ